MKITLSNISFKYNREYHDSLYVNLQRKKQNAKMAQFLASQDRESLKIEDKILEMEQVAKETNSVAYNDLVQFYVQHKRNIAFSICSIFPKLNYPEELIKQYTQEAKNLTNKNAVNWRLDLCNSLKQFAIIPTECQEIQQFLQNADASAETEAIAENNKNKSEIELLSLFIPESSSPKGFCDIVGMEELKTQFGEDIIQVVLNPEQAKLDEIEYGIKAARNFLLYGPPGCGKTFITQALAVESGLRMYKMDISKIGSRFVNQTSINIENAFEELKKIAKKENKPILLFMDEVDAIAKHRNNTSSSSGAEDSKAITTLLKYINEAKDYNIIIIAATNKYNLLDDAFISRFAVQKHIGLPDELQIKSLLKLELSKRTKGLKLAENDEELSNLSKELLGHSSRSIVFALDDAARLARRENRSDIHPAHILKAIEQNDFDKVDEQNYKKTKKKTRKIGVTY